MLTSENLPEGNNEVGNNEVGQTSFGPIVFDFGPSFGPLLITTIIIKVVLHCVIYYIPISCLSIRIE